MSKCRAVPGTAFADGRGERDGRRATGGQCGAASVGIGVRQVAQTERSGVQRLGELGCWLTAGLLYLCYRTMSSGAKLPSNSKQKNIGRINIDMILAINNHMTKL